MCRNSPCASRNSAIPRVLRFSAPLLRHAERACYNAAMRSNRLEPGLPAEPASIEVTMRLPGRWKSSEEFEQGLPPGCRTRESCLLLPDGSQFELYPKPADDEFAKIFATSCPKRPTDDECRRVDTYPINVCLAGAGGSFALAKQLMHAAAAVMNAGADGVFIDNCGLAHGATNWQELIEHADEGGLFWAFCSTVRSETELYSVGMHILGCCDAVLPRTGDDEYDARSLHSFLGFTAFSGETVSDGDIIQDPVLPTYHAHASPDDRTPADTPMHNPFGRWRLVPYDEQRN